MARVDADGEAQLESLMARVDADGEAQLESVMARVDADGEAQLESVLGRFDTSEEEPVEHLAQEHSVVKDDEEETTRRPAWCVRALHGLIAMRNVAGGDVPKEISEPAKAFLNSAAEKKISSCFR